MAVTATSPAYPLYEIEEAKKVASAIGIRHILIESNELDIAEFARIILTAVITARWSCLTN